MRDKFLNILLGALIGVLVTGFTSMVFVGSQLAKFGGDLQTARVDLQGQLAAVRVEVQGLRRDVDRLEKR